MERTLPHPPPPPVERSALAELGAADVLGLYTRMVRIREVEEEIQRQFLKGNVPGTTHSSAGQEATSVGVCSALADGDVVSATYRGHGHALSMGVSPRALLAEMFGRSTGVCGGRAGSMNILDHDAGLLGCFGIVGGSIAAAVGGALSGRRRGGVSVAFFGDGAVNQAYFAECLNFAAVHELPALFVCENNGYGEFTPMGQVTAGAGLTERAAVYGMPAERIDGNDVRAVRAAAESAVAHARGGAGPAFLECITYRIHGHSRSDPASYRPAEEVGAWQERDPLRITAELLTAELGVPAETVEAAAEEVREEVAAASRQALADPFPDAVEHAR